MIDLSKTNDSREILKKWCDDGMESISTTIRYGQLLELMNKLVKAEKDAARWRKLIEINDDINCELAVCAWHGGYEYSMIPDISEVIDAKIDEAMNGSNN